MRIIVIGDPHFKVSNVNETNRMVEEITKECQNLKPDLIVVLGDVFDRFEVVHVSPLARVTKFFKNLIDIAPLRVLVGNHDMINTKQFMTDQHSLVAFSAWDGLKIIDTTYQEVLDEFKLTYVPYVIEGRFKEALDLVGQWRDSHLIFAHQEFKGCKMGAKISVEGDEWDLNHPFVISGHIHDADQPQSNIYYTGTPIQHGFTDRDDKGIILVDLEVDKPIQPKVIKLDCIKKKTIEIQAKDIDKVVIDTDGRCLYRIILTGTTGEIAVAEKHPKIKKWEEVGHKIKRNDITQITEIAPRFNDSMTKYSMKLKQRIEEERPELLELYQNRILS